VACTILKPTKVSLGAKNTIDNLCLKSLLAVDFLKEIGGYIVTWQIFSYNWILDSLLWKPSMCVSLNNFMIFKHKSRDSYNHLVFFSCITQ